MELQQKHKLLGGDDHVQEPARQGGSHLDMPHFLQLFGHAVKLSEADILVRHLSTTKLASDLDLVPLLQKLLRHLHFGPEVVVVRPRTDADPLKLRGRVGLPMRFLLTPSLFIPVLTVVHDPAYRWFGVGGNLDEIKSPLLRKSACISGGLDPKLCPV